MATIVSKDKLQKVSGGLT
ncbi:bacteriocin [Klebsiella pneumoniae]|nr:bacteriocin [Klebsiella pneumoniae]